MDFDETSDLFRDIPTPTDLVASPGTGEPFSSYSRETLEGMEPARLLAHAEELQKACARLENENKYLSWEFRELHKNISYFSRAAKVAHELNASDIGTIVTIATEEMRGFFNCSFAALFLYNLETMRFELRKASKDLRELQRIRGRDLLLAKFFSSRDDPFLVEFNASENCFIFDDGERYSYEIPDFWSGALGGQALVFPLRVKQQDCLDPLTLGGLILGEPNEVLEAKDAETALFFSDLLSSSLHNAQLVQKLNELTIIDPLTQIYNRRHLMNQLSTAMIQARRHGHPLSIAMVDIDFFKNFNDTYGHICGDEVLREVATILKSGIRTGVDVPARYGGEEFILVMPFTDLETAVDVSDRIRKKIKARTVHFEGKELSVTCSFGVAEYYSGESLEKFIDRADASLYEAKNNGRDMVCAAISGRADV